MSQFPEVALVIRVSLHACELVIRRELPTPVSCLSLKYLNKLITTEKIIRKEMWLLF